MCVRGIPPTGGFVPDGPLARNRRWHPRCGPCLPVVGQPTSRGNTGGPTSAARSRVPALRLMDEFRAVLRFLADPAERGRHIGVGEDADDPPGPTGSYSVCERRTCWMLVGNWPHRMVHRRRSSGRSRTGGHPATGWARIRPLPAVKPWFRLRDDWTVCARSAISATSSSTSSSVVHQAVEMAGGRARSAADRRTESSVRAQRVGRETSLVRMPGMLKQTMPAMSPSWRADRDFVDLS